jgi:hypothetical protein
MSRTNAYLLPYSGRNSVIHDERNKPQKTPAQNRGQNFVANHQTTYTAVPVIAIEISDTSYNLLSICSFAISYVTAPVKVDQNESLSVRLSARNNLAPTGRIFMKFDIWVY